MSRYSPVVNRNDPSATLDINRVNINEFQFRCSQCSNAYVSAADLNTHVSTRHSSMAESTRRGSGPTPMFTPTPSSPMMSSPVTSMRGPGTPLPGVVSPMSTVRAGGPAPPQSNYMNAAEALKGPQVTYSTPVPGAQPLSALYMGQQFAGLDALVEDNQSKKGELISEAARHGCLVADFTPYWNEYFNHPRFRADCRSRVDAEAALSRLPPDAFVLRVSTQAGCVALTHRDKTNNMIVHSAIRMLLTSTSPDARWAVEGQTQTFRTLADVLQSINLR